jgi:hypothetical protein
MDEESINGDQKFSGADNPMDKIEPMRGIDREELKLEKIMSVLNPKRQA